MSTTPPKPRQLTEMRKKFCEIFVSQGSKNQTKAARLAGAKGDKAFANDAMKDPLVREYIAELEKKRDANTETVLSDEEVNRQTLVRDMARIFRNPACTDMARVKAGEVLGEWMHMADVQPPKDDDESAAKPKIFRPEWADERVH